MCRASQYGNRNISFMGLSLPPLGDTTAGVRWPGADHSFSRQQNSALLVVESKTRRSVDPKNGGTYAFGRLSDHSSSTRTDRNDGDPCPFLPTSLSTNATSIDDNLSSFLHSLLSHNKDNGADVNVAWVNRAACTLFRSHFRNERSPIPQANKSF